MVSCCSTNSFPHFIQLVALQAQRFLKGVDSFTVAQWTLIRAVEFGKRAVNERL